MCGVSWTAGECADFLIFFADHNVVFLLTLYKPVLKQTPDLERHPVDAMAQLQEFLVHAWTGIFLRSTWRRGCLPLLITSSSVFITCITIPLRTLKRYLYLYLYTQFDTISSSEECRVLLETLAIPEGFRSCLVCASFTQQVQTRQC